MYVDLFNKTLNGSYCRLAFLFFLSSKAVSLNPLMKPIAIIPARYASTRFPGKPLVSIQGRPMVQHVYERCLEVFDLVVVATDDERIEKAVLQFGGKVVMTSPNHPSGTDRCAEAAQIIAADGYDFDIVVNVQGDEPSIKKEQLELIIDCFKDRDTDIATLITPIRSTDLLFNPNKVKAVHSSRNFALYFSRQPIPFQRDCKETDWLNNHEYYLHLGLYAYRANVLQTLSKLAQTPLEQCEKLEQLRWLENGFKIKTAITLHSNFGIDTPEDLKQFEQRM